MFLINSNLILTLVPLSIITVIMNAMHTLISNKVYLSVYSDVRKKNQGKKMKKKQRVNHLQQLQQKHLQKHYGDIFRDFRRPNCPAGRPGRPAPVGADGAPRDECIRPKIA